MVSYTKGIQQQQNKIMITANENRKNRDKYFERETKKKVKQKGMKRLEIRLIQQRIVWRL